ncbi:MAG: ABC transporter permease [Terriglobia bacterium]
MKWIKHLFSRKRLYGDLSAEIEEHLAEKVEELVASGMSREEATFAARREFGNVLQIEERSREVWQWPSLENFFMDVRYGLRQLRKNPGFTSVAVITLALGIGVNTAMFSLFHDAILARLPISHPQELVQLTWLQGTEIGTTFNWPDYEPLLAPQPALPGLFASLIEGMNLRSGNVSERVRAHLVSGSYYSTLGVKAFLGRTLATGDDLPASTPAVVLSYAYWGRRFAFEPAVIDQTVYLDGMPFTVVGVAPQEFYGLNRLTPPDITCPLHVAPRQDRKSYYVSYFARLQPGVSIEQARAQVAVRFHALLDGELKPERGWMGKAKLDVISAATGEENVHLLLGEPLRVLSVLVGAILLICCTNMATLLLGRGAARSHEIAVRLALGAARGRVIRQLLTESVLLGATGGTVGLFVGYGVHALLRTRLAIDQSTNLQFRLHWPVLAFTAGVSLVCGIAFGLVPALGATAVNPGTVMKGDAPEAGRPWLGPTRAFLVVQVAASVLVLVGATLFSRTLRNLEGVDAGFNRDHLLLMTIDPRQARFQGDRVIGLLDELTERIRAVPGVRSAALAESALFEEGAQAIWVQGSAQSRGSAHYNDVGPDFFATAGIPLLIGREFSLRDRPGAPLVAIINQAFARKYFPGQNPLGRRFGDAGPTSASMYEIVGVVKDGRSRSLRLPAYPADFHSLWQSPAPVPFVLHVRVMGNTRATAASLGQAIRDFDPGLVVYDVRTMTEQVNGTLRQERTFAMLSLLFGGLALGLCCVGLYGVTAYSVTRRTEEIGIRMALGAPRTQVLWLFLRQTLGLVVIGVVIGTPIALVCARFVKSLLFGLTPTDPASLAIALFMLTGVATVACLLPARRATKVDPMVALRHE